MNRFNFQERYIDCSPVPLRVLLKLEDGFSRQQSLGRYHDSPAANRYTSSSVGSFRRAAYSVLTQKYPGPMSQDFQVKYGSRIPILTAGHTFISDILTLGSLLNY